MFSTDAKEIFVFANDPNATIGTPSISPLYNNHAWAWSHGFDDNVGLHAQAALLEAAEIPATLFMISNIVEDTRQENWIFDVPDIHRLMRKGWSLGNHSSDHDCDQQADFPTKIRDGYTRLSQIIAASPLPDFNIISFTAPLLRVWISSCSHPNARFQRY